MPRDAWQIEPLDARDGVGLRDLTRIYQEAIEPSEQKSADEIAAIVRDPRYVVLIARRGGDVAGFAMLFVPGGDFWLLEYMAVDAGLRSHGLGRALFLAASDAAATRNPGGACVLEVDQPDAAMPSSADAMRRVRFYDALGCRRIGGLDYVLPLDRQGTPPPMWLLVHRSDTASTMPRSTLARWLSTIYRNVYGQPPDDPRIGSMLSGLPDDVPLVRPQ